MGDLLNDTPVAGMFECLALDGSGGEVSIRCRLVGGAKLSRPMITVPCL